MLVIDTEVYKDYFLLAAKHLGSGKIKTFEMYAGHQPDLACHQEADAEHHYQL
jgi:hypothetical protein